MNLEEPLVSRILSRSLLPRTLYLAVWISDWTTFMRTEYRSPSSTVDFPLLFSVATKRVTISGQRCEIYKRIRCSGNVSDSRCLATDVSAVLLWLFTSDVQASCHNTIWIMYKDAISRKPDMTWQARQSSYRRSSNTTPWRLHVTSQEAWYTHPVLTGYAVRCSHYTRLVSLIKYPVRTSARLPPKLSLQANIGTFLQCGSQEPRCITNSTIRKVIEIFAFHTRIKFVTFYSVQYTSHQTFSFLGYLTAFSVSHFYVGYLTTLLVSGLYTINDRMINAYEGGCGMRTDTRNRNTRRMSALAPLFPPQIPRDLNWNRNLAAAVGSRRLSRRASSSAKTI
jgi:hypothetical protein